ncbi:MAG: ORF6N domain-containing protein [Candidatus Riflemargulisbacteria bacterium]
MEELISLENIQNKIYIVRGKHVMLDRDLAELYSVETKQLNKSVNRNIDRFPEKFRFKLTNEEYENLKFHFGTSSLRSNISILEKQHGGRRYLPYAFTEQGVSMLSAVLRSTTAIEISIKIIDSFVNMRRFLYQNASLFDKIDELKTKQLQYEFESNQKFRKIFHALEEKSEITPKQGIFYEGQIFDAYAFVSNLIKSAENSIILIDNYIDESIFTLLSKRNRSCKAVIFTKDITKQLELDIEKHNAQYPEIKVNKFELSHDRFLIIDNKIVYHIGASLKDLGKKWFAFSKMDIDSLNLIERLERKGPR